MKYDAYIGPQDNFLNVSLNRAIQTPLIYCDEQV